MIAALLWPLWWTLCAVGAAWFSAEAAARLWLRARPRFLVHRPFVRRERRIATDVLPGLSPVARFEANADGERGGPVPSDPERTLRWCVAGGSAAECYLLDQHETWSSVLETELSRALGTSAHVGNVARSLAPCRSLADMLEHALQHVRGLDGVVLMVGASDLVAWLEAGAPAAPPRVSRSCWIDLIEEHPLGPFSWIRPRGTALFRLARRLAARLRRRPETQQRVGASIAAHRRRRHGSRPHRARVPDPSAMLAAYREDLGHLLDVAGARAPRVVVALQPWLDATLDDEGEARLWNFGAGSPYRGEVSVYFATPAVRALLGRIEEVTRDVATARGHGVVELRGRVPSDFDHYYDLLHFTPRGAALVGVEVARAVLGAESGARPLAA